MPQVKHATSHFFYHDFNFRINSRSFNFQNRIRRSCNITATKLPSWSAIFVFYSWKNIKYHSIQRTYRTIRLNACDVTHTGQSKWKKLSQFEGNFFTKCFRSSLTVELSYRWTLKKSCFAIFDYLFNKSFICRLSLGFSMYYHSLRHFISNKYLWCNTNQLLNFCMCFLFIFLSFCSIGALFLKRDCFVVAPWFKIGKSYHLKSKIRSSASVCAPWDFAFWFFKSPRPKEKSRCF